MAEINSYTLSRSIFDFSFENPDKVKPVHIALFFFAIEHCNRLGWKEKFGLPTTMTMEAIGVRSYNTYKYALLDLVEWKFIKMIEISKNQYSSNIIALSNFNKASNKALDKALIKHTLTHSTKQSESTVQSIDSIIKQQTINHEQQTTNNKQDDVCDFIIDEEDKKNCADADLTVLCLKILADFGFSETRDHGKRRHILNFLNHLDNNKKLPWFILQYPNYWEYKKISGEKKQYLETFLGLPENLFEGAGWEKANWIDELKEYKNGKQSGQNNKPAIGAGNRSDGRKDFGTL